MMRAGAQYFLKVYFVQGNSKQIYWPKYDVTFPRGWANILLWGESDLKIRNQRIEMSKKKKRNEQLWVIHRYDTEP